MGTKGLARRASAQTARQEVLRFIRGAILGRIGAGAYVMKNSCVDGECESRTRAAQGPYVSTTCGTPFATMNLSAGSTTCSCRSGSWPFVVRADPICLRGLHHRGRDGRAKNWPRNCGAEQCEESQPEASRNCLATVAFPVATLGVDVDVVRRVDRVLSQADELN